MVSLESSKFFSSLTAAELEEIRPQIRELPFPPNTVIFKEGDQGDGVYIIKSGIVQISNLAGSTDKRIFSRIGVGDFFGEMSVLDNEPRSATAIAEKPTELYFIPRETMLDLLNHSPRLALMLTREVSHRLREFNRHYISEVLQAERLTLVGRFARSIVHDLKNPLNIIGIASELACMEESTPETRKMTRDRIQKQVERISAMVNEILDFTMSSHNSTVLALANYKDFVAPLIEELNSEISLKSSKIQLETQIPSVRVSIAPKRLSRVFYNLVHNATDAMPEGGLIKIRFLESANEVVTEIEDSGHGIPNEIAAQLFEAFVTFGKAHGTGMGLSICKKIVEDHRGKIQARNRPGGGAIFSFSLPIAA